MTIDDRLTRAGESFRAAHPEPAAVHLAPGIAARPARRTRGRGRVLGITVAAAVVVALTVGVVAWLGTTGRDAPRPAATTPDTVAASGSLAALVTGVWRLATVDTGSDAAVRPAYAYTLTFASSEGQGGQEVMGLDDDCNGTGAPIALEADTIRITGMAGTTLKACQRPVDPAAAAVTTLFDGPAITWAIIGTDLRLQTTTATLTFAQVPPAALSDEGLPRTAWSLVGIVDGGSLVPVAADGSTELRFDDAGTGQLQAGDGCNTVFGGYAVDGDTLTLTDSGGTDRFCHDTAGVHQAVDEVFADGDVTAGRADNRLTLTRDDVTLVYDLVGEG